MRAIDCPQELAPVVQEMNDLLDALEQGLLAMQRGACGDTIDALFRAAHTLKGNAMIVGALSVADLTQALEGVLTCVRDGALVATPSVAGGMLQAVHALRGAVEAVAAGAIDPGLCDGAGELLAALEALSIAPAAADRGVAGGGERTLGQADAVNGRVRRETLREWPRRDRLDNEGPRG